MAHLVYVDETGADGPHSKRQPLLRVVAAMVHEDMVPALDQGLRRVAWDHLGWVPADIEFHGYELWGAHGHWQNLSPPQLIAAYEAAIELVDTCDIDIAYASIDKAGLRARYSGAADDNAYVLALEYLLEKVDRYGSGKKIVVADEHHAHQLRALKMMSSMQRRAGAGEVPGIQLTTIIDSLHFVSSHDSAGVQMADLIAYVLQRRAQGEHHPDAQAAMSRLSTKVDSHVRTYRMPWP